MGDAASHPILVAEGVSVSFGGVRALTGVDVRVRPMERLGLIGPNGSGKTTFLNVVCGYVRPAAGRVYVGDVDVTRGSPADIARRGVARVFQTVEVFGRLTLLENLVAARARVGETLPRLLWTPSLRREVASRARQLLAYVGLVSLWDREARDLSFAQQRLLEIAMAMMSDPKVLLLDESTAGVNREMVDKIVAVLRRFTDEGGTLVVVEHDVDFVFAVCERVVVLESGQVIADGPPAEVRRAPQVVQAYLGRGLAA